MSWRDTPVPDHVLTQPAQSTPSDNNKLEYWLEGIRRCNCESEIFKAVEEFRIHNDWSDEDRATISRCYMEQLIQRR